MIRQQGGPGETRLARWWDRFWGGLWVAGSLWIAYQTARWFAANASPAALGPLRYGLIVFAFLFGLLVGMAVLSLAIIAVTVALEWLLSKLGHPLRPPAPDERAAPEAGSAEGDAPSLQPPGPAHVSG